MSHNRLVYDGLWRCLCPAIDRQTLLKAVQSPTVLRPPLHRSTPAAQSVAKITAIHRRNYGTNNLHAARGVLSESWTDTPSRSQPRRHSWEEELLAPTPPSEETLKKTSVDHITAALLTIRGRYQSHGRDIDRHARIVQLVTHLVRTRAQPLKPFIYECMMDAMADPQGSTRGIRGLFKDLSAQGMKPTATMCQSALRALMVHPDYVLRQEVLFMMQTHWFAVETSDQQSILVGLLRDEQYELAYENLINTIEKGVNLEIWVYDVFIMVLGKLGFVDEMLQILYRRKTAQALYQGGAKEVDMAYPNLLYHALEACSQAFHITGTVYTWDKLVRRLQVPPPDAVVENTLATAARYGHSDLAVEALDLLSQRSRFQAHHYEAAAEAFCKSGNIEGALGILNLMAQNGVVISQKNTRMLYLMLKTNPSLVEEAVSILEKLQQERVIPPAAIASIVEAIAELRGGEATMKLCGAFQEVTGEESDATILRHLICHSRTLELRQSLLKSYEKVAVERGDSITTTKQFNQFIPVCLEAGEWDLAFRLATDAMKMTSVGGPREQDIAWFRPLFHGAIAREDARIWQVVDELIKSANDAIVQSVREILKHSRIRRPDDPGASAVQELQRASET
ncbi:hypothetical protein HJFPF1_03323 [Paramyrothecium foliicola]|nr:hypothetical protein HJFPF1_03323 [Paramyrothecium foliicola]